MSPLGECITMLGQLLAGNKSFTKIKFRLSDKHIILETKFLIIKSQVSFYLGEYKIPSKVISFFRPRSSGLEKNIEGIKRREKFTVENF